MPISRYGGFLWKKIFLGGTIFSEVWNGLVMKRGEIVPHDPCAKHWVKIIKNDRNERMRINMEYIIRTREKYTIENIISL